MKEIYMRKRPINEIIINIVIFILFVFCFLSMFSDVNWIIILLLFVFTFFKNKEILKELLSSSQNEKHILLKKMIVFDENNTMYIIYNTKIMIISIIFCLLLSYVYIFDYDISLYIIIVIALINFSELIEFLVYLNYERNPKKINYLINNKNRHVRKAVSVSLYKDGVYEIQSVGLGDNSKKAKSLFAISNNYKNYKKLISKINFLCQKEENIN